MTIAEDKRSATIDWKRLGGKDTEFTVTVKVPTEHYGDKTFTYTVTLQGIAFENGKITTPEYMGEIQSVTCSQADITVSIESDGTLVAETEQDDLVGNKEIELTLDFADVSFTLTVNAEVVKAETPTV